MYRFFSGFASTVGVGMQDMYHEVKDALTHDDDDEASNSQLEALTPADCWFTPADGWPTAPAGLPSWQAPAALCPTAEEEPFLFSTRRGREVIGELRA